MGPSTGLVTRTGGATGKHMYSFVHGTGQSHTCVHLPSASHQAQPHAEPPPQQFFSPEPSGPPTTTWLRAHESVIILKDAVRKNDYNSSGAGLHRSGVTLWTVEYANLRWI